MAVLKQWSDQTFRFWGEDVTLRLKALSSSESPDLLTKVDRIGAIARGEVKGETLYKGHLGEEWIKKAFADYVEPVDVEVEGKERDKPEKITSGEGLFEIATPGLVMNVLLRLQELAVLTDEQGKDSGSPSTPDSEEATSASD